MPSLVAQPLVVLSSPVRQGATANPSSSVGCKFHLIREGRIVTELVDELAKIGRLIDKR